ncbi:MAG: NADH-quinone oxidoreductase subunit NuoE [Bacteroidota bacterium]
MSTVEYTFTPEEVAEIQKHVAKYPERRSAVMPALWIAQEKFGWLSEEAMRLVATTIDIPYAHVYGVATFYTMYFKKKVPKHLIEVCTCFSCLETGGPEMLSYVKEKIGADENGYGKDGKIWARAAECLGACDTAPMCQITNRRYAHNLTKEKVDALIAKLEKDEEIPYERIPLNDQTIID